MAREPDDYESNFMTGDVLFREKLTMPRWLIGLVTLSVLLGVGGAAIAAGTLAAVAGFVGLTVVMLALMLSMAALRIAVTTDHVKVQYGVLGPKIPIEAIEHCEAENYAIWKYGGWGIRFSPIDMTWCYNMFGDRGKAVRIHYRTRLGLRKVLVAGHNHVELARAINAARRAKGHVLPDAVVLDGLADANENEVQFEHEEQADHEHDAAHEQHEHVEVATRK